MALHVFWLTMCINSIALWENMKINEHFDLKHLRIVKTKHCVVMCRVGS